MATNYIVIERDGSKSPFDATKIRKAITWAVRDLKVNPLELESKFHLNLRDNIKTSELQETLINCALSLTNIENLENLEWRFAAARLLLLDLYKKARVHRSHLKFKDDGPLDFGSFYDFVKLAVEKGVYEDTILKEYTSEELEEIGKIRTMSYDRQFDYAGINLLKSRYLMKLNEEIFELPQDMYLTLALFLAVPEKKDNRLEMAKQFYHNFASRKISPATPILLNLRRKSGNLASCFITAMDDSLDSIYYTLEQVAQISKNAGGVGVNVSRVRCLGSYIQNIKGVSGGVVPWIKLINDTAVAVDQLGSRSGAVTVALDVWHRDVERFLHIQSENGDLRTKSFDVFPQLVMCDEFLRRVENNEKWTLLDPYEVKKKYEVSLPEIYGEEFEKHYKMLENCDDLELKKVVGAKELFKVFLKTAVETGLPYVFFKDTANRVNPNSHIGMIGNCNLCCESFSNFSPSSVGIRKLSDDRKSITQKISDVGEVHTCNLVSLNLAELNTDEELEMATKLSVRILDNAIEITKPPIPESEKHNYEYRILGIGSLGLADWLAKRGISYHASSQKVDELFEKIALAGTGASCDLARERGTYFHYKGSMWERGLFFGKDESWFDKFSTQPLKWRELREKVQKWGLRNGGLFAIAPNTSTSLLVGASASVLPIYRKFFLDKGSKGSVPVCPPFLDEKTFWSYVENQNVNQQHVVDIVSHIQKWTDQGISMEILLNLQGGMNAKDVYDLYMSAWKKGCKAVYYARSITKVVEERESEECVSCSN